MPPSRTMKPIPGVDLIQHIAHDSMLEVFGDAHSPIGGVNGKLIEQLLRFCGRRFVDRKVLLFHRQPLFRDLV